MRFDGATVTAVLGPTNTGKTFLAIERMIAHSSGVIGLPLRLLAREVYQKVADRVGVRSVSLITGEEKIKPPNARYSVCTVEAMPRDPGTAFVAIDEVQLATDLERGHVFTDRILNTRGREETLLLGASTMQGVLQRLLKGASTVTRPRMSNLLYAGSKKITRLPRRSAIVAFSAEEVYAIAELIRRQRGGAAVVLGALSPRTRNSQVELYQSGDVDFLVATDAIGMGLNLDVDHVAFAQDWKFDGYQYRQLTPAELAQIAGRAGRHVRDGTFGVTGQVDPFADEVVEAVESHAFPPVRVLQWRSEKLDFSTIGALRDSLEAVPPSEDLTRSLPSVDQRALEFLSKDGEVVRRTRDARHVELLWETCKLPDYRRIAPAQHAEIISTIYQDLVERGAVAEDYMAAQVRRADRTEGDLDTLSQRIAEIRTWTYISHRPGWLVDPTHWQEKTRAIEDRLSDALHERLTKRFVDRRTSVLMRRLRENAYMEAEISGDGTVSVEGHPVGELQGFRFTPDTTADGPDAKAVRAAAQKSLSGEFERRAERFANSPNGDLALGSDGLLRWLGAPVASLTAGEDALKPNIVLLADEQLTGPARDKVAARADRYVTYQVSTVLKPLADLQVGLGLEGAAKGLAYRLYENFGLIQRRDVSEEVRTLDQNARAGLRRLGVRFGAYHIFVPALIKPAPASLVTLLWAIRNDGRDKPGFGDVTHLLATGRTSAVPDASFEPVFYTLAGYRVLGRRAVRVDILERLADLIRPALAWKPGTGRRPEGGYNGSQFLVTPAMMSILGATSDDMDEVLKALGYRAQAMKADDVEKTVADLDAAAEAARLAAEAARKAEAEASAAASATDSPSEAPAAEPVEATEPGGEPQADAEIVATEPENTDSVAEAEETESAVEPEAVDAEPSHAVEEADVSEKPEAAAVETVAEESESPQATESDPVQADEPKMINVWRPHRFEGRGQRHGHGRGDGRGHRRHGQPAQAAGQDQQNRQDQQPRPERQGRPDRNGQPRRNEAGQGQGRAGGEERQRRDDRRPNANRGEDKRERFGKDRPRPDKGGRSGKSDWRADMPARQQRNQQVDPDSPFAKLAALKDKLKS
ncbi:ATP-dependent RNA helicase SUPV3L1/SUV3 [Consotaella salsifontis]|uniref:ATP-dependent RNA helicase SUPV3L1/SUV3 n=1 Tax=Consotaella salsifontis TaxID=1365950 RepID=A0A1T4SR68_9HYPH|nr:ATP-dependent RNA helicase SUPV3L1/SUV3 [Consotaella salsifontis]